MTSIFLRGNSMPGYAPSGLRGAGRVHQPSRQSGTLVHGCALVLALLLASTRATFRLLLSLCEQVGRAAPTLLLAVVLVALFQLLQPLFTQFDLPLSKVQLVADSAPIDAQQVQQHLAPVLEDSGFFSLDLKAAQQSLESLPLIASADLRRYWPGQLVAELTLHQPLARWGEQGLLAESGKLLPSGAEQFAHLPQLLGEEGSSQVLFAQYQQLQSMLGPLRLRVTRLEKRARGSGFLSAMTDSGNTTIQFALGRGDWSGKMQRFIHLAQQAQMNLDNLVRVDLRHQNGLAVALTPPPTQQEAAQ